MMKFNIKIRDEKHLGVLRLCVIFFLLGTLFSCKDKDEDITPENNDVKHKLMFHVNGFEQEISPMLSAKTLADAEDADVNYVQTLEYRSFDEDGKTVGHYQQSSPSDRFGTIMDELPAGSYHIVIYGARSTGKKVPYTLDVNDIHNTTFNTGFFYPSKTDPNGQDEWYAKECFAYRAKIVVGNEDQNIDVSLTRVSSIIELKLLDNAIPDNVAKIKISFNPTYTTYNPFPSDDTFGEPTKENGTVTYEVSDRSRKTFLAYPTPADSAELKCKVYLTLFNANNNVLDIKEINNVGVKRNMKTILSGYLFDGISGKSYTVGVDPEWTGVQQELEF